MTFKTAPFKHQLAAFERSCDRENFALLMEAGTGKSKVAIDSGSYLYEKGAIDTVLVVAPNGVHRAWVDQQFPVHCAAPYLAAHYRSGPSKALQSEWDTMDYVSGVLRVLAINSEAISHRSGVDWCKRMMRKHRTLLVLDESHQFKTPGAKRTKAAYALSALASYRRILSGTPVSNGYEDLYSQFKFLHWSIIGCKTFAEFKSLYCEMGGYEFREIVKYHRVDELLAKIAPYCFEANKRDCLDLPPQTWITRDVELSDEQKTLYKQLRLEFLAELRNGHTIEAPLAITRLIRLQQVLSGFLPNGAGGFQELSCPRISDTIDLVEEALRGKVIVWCRFKEDIHLLKKELVRRRIHGVTYHGDMNTDARARALELFTNDPEYRVFLATRDSGGTGLTINAADTVVNHSHGWSYTAKTQAEARNHRIGQEHPVTYYEMRVPKSLDDKILKELANKGDMASRVKDMEYLRQLVEE